MQVETFINALKKIQIETIAGIPDSLLSQFCDYLNQEGKDEFHHYVPANEGAAVGIAAGSYIASNKPALVYMQNSGIGNTINPIASLLHKDVYQIPMLFLVGWRGEPGKHDEPQHVFQGKVTCRLFEDMQIAYEIIDETTSEAQLQEIFVKVQTAFANKEQFAIIVRRNTFAKRRGSTYQNTYSLVREEAIATILQQLDEQVPIISTTGKISREVYEQSDKIYENHKRCFLTVGSMGHASMLAFGMASVRPDKKFVCLDGDGAVLMHMGSLAFLAKQNPSNFLHIVLNNDAHESVGGMPTGAAGQSYAGIAEQCGYPHIRQVSTMKELEDALCFAKTINELMMIEVMVKQGARDNLGRPKETPCENKDMFMTCFKEDVK